MLFENLASFGIDILDTFGELITYVESGKFIGMFRIGFCAFPVANTEFEYTAWSSIADLFWAGFT